MPLILLLLLCLEKLILSYAALISILSVTAHALYLVPANRRISKIPSKYQKQSLHKEWIAKGTQIFSWDGFLFVMLCDIVWWCLEDSLWYKYFVWLVKFWNGMIWKEDAMKDWWDNKAVYIVLERSCWVKSALHGIYAQNPTGKERLIACSVACISEEI